MDQYGSMLFFIVLCVVALLLIAFIVLYETDEDFGVLVDKHIFGKQTGYVKINGTVKRCTIVEIIGKDVIVWIYDGQRKLDVVERDSVICEEDI